MGPIQYAAIGPLLMAAVCLSNFRVKGCFIWTMVALGSAGVAALAF